MKFYIWAKPQEQLSYEVSGKIKCQWLETDICSVAYKDKNKKLRSFVATYGDRQEIKSSSYYHVISAITRKLVKWWTI